MMELTGMKPIDVMKLIELKQDENEEQQRQIEQEKNINFIQLYRDNMPAMRELMAKNPFASSVLFFILEHMDNRNTLACSNAVLEEYFDKSRSTIQRATKTLVEGGFVAKFKVGNSSVYTVNPDLAWTDKRTNKKFSKYDGNILVSKKESLDYFHSENYEKFKKLREKLQN
ncbi:TPA: replication/maintenance protein RepL [Bacillus cereus]|nr:replication/maintenance protein RepL [Bacillus cereus]